jgi:hypothetical protein
VESHPRLEARDCPGNACHHVTRHFYRYRLDSIEIASIVDADIDRHRKLFLRQAHVGDYAAGQFRVGNDDNCIAKHPNLRASPSDSGHISLLATFQFDKMAAFDRFLHDHVDAREKICERFLQRQRYGYRTDTKRSNYRRYPYAGGVEKRQEPNAMMTPRTTP